MNGQYSSLRRRFALLLACILFSTASVGQDREQGVREEDIRRLNDEGIVATDWIPSPRRRALALLKDYELVAAGEFEELLEPIEGDATAFNPNIVVVTFRILDVYKGSVPDTVRLELNSDMLVVPETNISQYVKRQQVRQGQSAEKNAIDQQTVTLETSLQAGTITRETYQDELGRLTAARDRLVAESLLTSTRQVNVIHGKTFYDLGGAIKPGEQYLIGVNRTRDRVAVYALEEVPANTNIFWGHLFDDIKAELEVLVR